MRIAAAVTSMWAGMLRKVGLHPKKNSNTTFHFRLLTMDLLNLSLNCWKLIEDLLKKIKHDMDCLLLNLFNMLKAKKIRSTIISTAFLLVVDISYSFYIHLSYYKSFISQQINLFILIHYIKIYNFWWSINRD